MGFTAIFRPQVLIKLAATPEGALQCMSKDSRKNVRFVANHGITIQDWHRMGNEHRAKNRGAFGAVAPLKRVDLLLHARQQVELHNNEVTDFTAWVWALRGIQCGEIRLDDTWALTSTGKIDVTKIAVVQDLTWNGAGATQRRLFEAAAGRFDLAGRPFGATTTSTRWGWRSWTQRWCREKCSIIAMTTCPWQSASSCGTRRIQTIERQLHQRRRCRCGPPR